jgi:hypothetical protein
MRLCPVPAFCGATQLVVSTAIDSVGVLGTAIAGRAALTGAARLAAAADTSGLMCPASMASWLKLKLPLQDRLELEARSDPVQGLPSLL